MKRYVQKVAAILTGALSVAIVWSEVTFFRKSPVLSLFARFVNFTKENYDYVSIEVSGLFLLIIIWFHCKINNSATNFSLISATVHDGDSVFLLLYIFDGFENSRFEFVLSSIAPPNQRIQFDIQWHVTVSFDTSHVSQFFRPNSHGFSYYKNTHLGNTLYSGTAINFFF